MKEKTPISEIKAKAKEELLGNYSVAIGSFVLLFVFIYAIMSLLYSGAMSFAFAGRVGTQGASAEQLEAMLTNDRMSMMLNILVYIIMAFASPIIGILSTGFTYICREISYGRRPKTSDLFYVIKHHPDKIIIISLIVYVIHLVFQLPSILYESMAFSGEPTGPQFLIYVLLFLAGSLIRLVIQIAISQCYLLYLDNDDMPALSYLKTSITMMKGNMWRYFYLLLTFVGYYLLMLISIGVASLWVVPYKEVALVDFYKDLKERCNVDYRV